MSRKAIHNKYMKDPILFMTDCLDVEPEHVWPKMREVAESVRDHKFTAVKAGHSVSKTYTAARLALWFLYNHYPSTVVTTAPIHKQVEEVLWREIRGAHANAKVPLGGMVTKTKIDLEERWFAIGFATKPDTVTQQATAFQGYHNRYVLIIFDEAAGILRGIWEAAKTLMASGYCKFLAIGNPTSATGEFPNCFKNSDFSKITISVLDTPNYKQNDEVVPGLSGRDFEQRVAKEHGRESNYYKARVLGQIPTDDVDAIIHVSDLEDAFKRQFYLRPPKRCFIAGDPADGGDESVFYYMEDTDIIDATIFRKENILLTAALVKKFAESHKCEWYVGDAIGIGKGVLDALKKMGMKCIPVVSSERQASGVPDIYYNRRAQIWIEAGEDFSMQNVDLNWHDDVLEEQLTSVKQDVLAGRIIIQPKKEIRKLLGRSPDRADAYVIGLYGRKKIRMPIKAKRDRYRQRRQTTAMAS